MNKTGLLISVMVFLNACNSNQKDNSTTQDSTLATPATAITPDTVCYERRSGNNNQDIAAIQLITFNDEVSGKFMNMPYEKDAAIGLFKARKEGDIIMAEWYVMQEGVMDTVALEFKWDGDKIFQKEFSYNTQTGKPYLKAETPFNIEFNKTDCNKLPKTTYP